jgi:N-acetylglucosaminyldiphosphoundecaprenol N-acetyl-beta-D-mannosaminyltransferase
MKFVNLMGYNILSNIDSIKLEKGIINTINPHSYCIAKKDKLFKKSLINADILIPDGIGMVFAAKLINNTRINKISGSDIHKYLLEYANVRALKVFYMGSTKATLDLIKKKINKLYPKIDVYYYSPPFKEEFSKIENKKIINKIKLANPDILFVGMTAPKQEKWVEKNKLDIDVNIIASVGAVFDFFAEKIKRPNYLFRKIGLEWFIRLCNEPKRLWKRTFISIPIFIYDIILYKLYEKKIQS